MLQFTQGLPVEGFKTLSKIEDEVRLTTVYLDAHGNMTIGFGGTRASFWDIMLDLMAFPEMWHEYRCHAGANYETQSVIWEIMRLIKIHQPSKVVISGHSQGGAHAVLTAIAISRELHIPVDVTTFGALPAIFGKHDVQFPVTNYLLRGDPMAWVPWWIIGLRFSGSVVKLGRKSWPSVKLHDPKEYEIALTKLGE